MTAVPNTHVPNVPKTLRQFAAMPDKPGSPQRSVLILIDAQLEYVRGLLPLHGMARGVAEAATLLALARAHAMPVFHVVHHGRPGGPLFDPLSELTDIIPELAPASGETVVTKSLPNGFAGTSLHARIERTGRQDLIFAGFATHMCLSATVRAALDLGYRSTVIAAATATRDLPSRCGGAIVPAAQIQEVELAVLADRDAVVVADVAAFLAREI